VATKTDGSVWAWGSVNTAGQLGDGTTVAHTVPALVKENTAPQVTLTYPLGTKEAPEASNVSQPVIRWSQSDAALTNFAAYQVQVLDASGAVVVDSGEIKQQWMIDGVNTWTVNKALPVGQAFQVRVKVYDEQLWSEWSGIGWIKYNKQQISMYRNYLRIASGQETTVTLTVYGTDGLVNTDFNGLQKVTITGYQTTSQGISGQFGKKELVNSGTTVVDIYFHQGIAEIPLSLNQIGHHALSFLLDDVEIGNLDIEIISSKEENSEYGNNLRISSGEETTVTLAVYGTNGLVNTDFNGLQKVTITGYQTTSEGISGQFGKKELVNSGTTVADIYFHQGIAEISLSLNQIGHHTLSFLLDDVEIGNLDIEIIPSKEEYELKFAELPTLINSKGEFDLSSIIVFTNKSGNLLGVSKSKRGTWATNKDHYK
jgi:hypothetical protein